MASVSKEVLREAVECFVEIAVVCLLLDGVVDGFGLSPEDVVRGLVVDGESEHGQRIGCTVLLVVVGWTVWCSESEFKNQVGFGWMIDQREQFGGLKPLVEIVVGAACTACKGFGEEATVSTCIGDEDCLSSSEGRRDGGLRGVWGLRVAVDGKWAGKHQRYERTEGDLAASHLELQHDENASLYF